MLVEYNTLRIRNAAAKDAAQLAAWWNDGRVMAHAGFSNGLGISAEEIAGALEQDSDETRRRLIMEKDGAPIGETSYRSVGGDTAEIGIKICDFTMQDKGLGKVLLSMLIGSLFNEYGYKRIVLDTNLNNKRAQHVYEELGFKKTGVRMNCWRDQLGVLQSAVDYELYPDGFISFCR